MNQEKRETVKKKRRRRNRYVTKPRGEGVEKRERIPSDKERGLLKRILKGVGPRKAKSWDEACKEAGVSLDWFESWVSCSVECRAPAWLEYLYLVGGLKLMGYNRWCDTCGVPFRLMHGVTWRENPEVQGEDPWLFCSEKCMGEWVDGIPYELSGVELSLLLRDLLEE